MVIDCHVHYSGGQDFVISTPQGFISDMDSNNIARSLLLPLDGLRLSHDYEKDNDLISSVVNAYPNRFAGLGIVNPRRVESAVAEMTRCITQKNLIGMKFHPWLQAFSPLEDCFMEVAAEANRLKTLFLFHDGTPPYSEPFQIEEVARRYPDLTIVLGHTGLVDLWREALLSAQKRENIWLCFCGTPFWGMKEAAIALNGERIVWGSDYPLANLADTRERIQQVELLPVSDAIKERIFYSNGKELLGRFEARRQKAV